MKPWEMILAHRFEEAAKIYREKVHDSPEDPGPVGGLATAMLCLGRLTEALEYFRKANAIENRELRGQSEPYLEKIGGILWILGRRLEALQTFKRKVDGIGDGSIKYSDNAGGISPGLLLWFASIGTGDQSVTAHSLKYLTKLAKKSRIHYWPGPIALFLLGKSSIDEVLSAACGTPDFQQCNSIATGDLLKRRQLVNALFYLAVRARDLGDEDKCRELLSQCRELRNPVLEIEWYLSDSEIGPVAAGKGSEWGVKS